MQNHFDCRFGMREFEWQRQILRSIHGDVQRVATLADGYGGRSGKDFQNQIHDVKRSIRVGHCCMQKELVTTRYRDAAFLPNPKFQPVPPTMQSFGHETIHYGFLDDR